MVPCLSSLRREIIISDWMAVRLYLRGMDSPLREIILLSWWLEKLKCLYLRGMDSS